MRPRRTAVLGPLFPDVSGTLGDRPRSEWLNHVLCRTIFLDALWIFCAYKGHMNGRQPLRVFSGAVLVTELCADDTALCGRVESFLGASAALYPEIEEWWRRRVLPDLHRRERVCYTAREEGRLVGLCIGKIDSRSTKLCTLRVDESVQSSGVGSLLLGRLFRDVARFGGRQVHFTISEAVDSKCGAYFRRLGFFRRAYFGRPGRDAGDELIYSMSRARLTF